MALHSSNSDSRKRISRKLILEGLMALIISVTPVIFYSYEYLPKVEGESWEVLGLSISDNGFLSVSTFFWYLLSKVIPLSLLVLWFLTCKNWWYHVIIIPISMYAFQLITLFTSNETVKLDKEELLWLLLVCMVVIPFVYFIRIKLYDKYVHGIDLEAMDAELQELKEKPELKSTVLEGSEITEQEIPINESLTDSINRKLSTGNIEQILKHWQHRLQDWLHLKF